MDNKTYHVSRDGKTIYTGDMAACFACVAKLRRDQPEYKGDYEISGEGKIWNNKYKELSL